MVTVDLQPMADVEDVDNAVVLADPVDHAVGAAAVAVTTGKRPGQRPADPVSGPVNIGTMVDAENNDALLLIVDLIRHPVRATPGKPDPCQPAAQRFSNPARRGQQVSGEPRSTPCK